MSDVSSGVVIDATVLQIVLRVLIGWLERREQEALAYLIEETGYCGANWVGDGSGSRTPTGVGWLRAPIAWAARPSGRSRRSRRRIRCCGGTGS